jgi:hypothetical protein
VLAEHRTAERVAYEDGIERCVPRRNRLGVPGACTGTDVHTHFVVRLNGDHLGEPRAKRSRQDARAGREVEHGRVRGEIKCRGGVVDGRSCELRTQPIVSARNATERQAELLLRHQLLRNDA